jgi:membrane-associated protease RseP (regulator of RpoE activity)
MAYAIGVLVMFVGLLVSIALHEVGHMVPAKKFGVRVSQYMVGFGPTLWSRTKGETEYGVKAIPLGGYVRLTGMYPPAEAVGNPSTKGFFGRMAEQSRQASADEILPGEDHRAFYRLSTPKKLVVMMGGPVMNLVIAVVLFTVMLVGFGAPGYNTTLMNVSQCVLPVGADARPCTATDQVAPAAAAGLKAGDTVVSYGGVSISSWDQLQGLIRGSTGAAVPIVVERDGTRIETTLTPVIAERPVVADDGSYKKNSDGSLVTDRVGFAGITPTSTLVPQSITTVPGFVGNALGQTFGVIVTLPARVVDVAHAAFGTGPRDASSVIGVVGIGRFAGEIASEKAVGYGVSGQIRDMLGLIGGLNLALFAFNMIPLLPLDGGHVAGALWEGARRQIARLRGLPRPRPVDIARMTPIAYGVFVLLAGMGVLLIYADIVHPVVLGG